MIPNKVQVGVLEYEIQFVDFVDKDNAAGECDDTTGVIKIKRGMPESFTRDTVFHEILHAINIDMSEAEVLSFSRSVMLVCRDNSWLQDLLFPPQE